ncbi:Cyclochlorotine biosynthesis protein O [Colletotrichum siamense]|uniref:Cyclochlorotine biosynthesis protein O n=1 Tax=Colletotrichum siamense TaxID=690259 RepID=UPI0018723B98|nr:Cyclochlorotine biosynthesis protein O [Colletotrichum siamense]KAF5511011.1 Cyclochlorotine biosynthesis protein O [Colletotrichum siamense]
MWSPALDAVEYVQIDFADAFNATSIYREHGFEVPPERLSGMNRSEEDHLMHVPPEVGDGYVGLLEVYHQLHCLNIVRMYTWWQAGKYDEPPVGLSNDPLKNRMHVDHCLDALRIALMCWGDVTPLLVRLGGPAGARADFETHHKCRDFNAIENWIENNWTVK